MQYVQCKFRREDTRSYTYTYDGAEPLAIDDEVKVPDKSGDGWKRVYVTSFSDEKPSFPCKAIIGKAEPEGEKPARESVPVITEDFLDLGDDEITF